MDMKEISELIREFLMLEENESEIYSKYVKAKEASREKQDEINKHLNEGDRINVHEFIVNCNHGWYLIKVSREKGKGCLFFASEIDAFCAYNSKEDA